MSARGSVTAPVYVVCDYCGFFYADIQSHPEPVRCEECGSEAAWAFPTLDKALLHQAQIRDNFETAEPRYGHWKLLSPQGPPSRCSTPHCDGKAVAVHIGARRRRWACFEHLPALSGDRRNP